MTRRSPRSLLLTLMLVATGCGPTWTVGTDDRVADRGIGGTGIAVTDRGIGGTGIVGTVTAFGSVWVNGLRVDLPPTTPVRIEGRPASSTDIRVGHTVAMTAAAGGPTGLTARTLEVRFAVAGPVERIDTGTPTGEGPAGGVVMGQRIDAADAEGRTALGPGRWVAVSGLRRPDGAIDASRVEAWDPAEGWVLRGRLDAVTPTTLTVAGLTLARGPTLAGALPAVGSLVRVAGSAASGGSALAVAPDPFNPFGTTVNTLSVEAYVDETGQTATPDGPRIERPAGNSVPARVVIDSVVTSGGDIGRSRAFGAPRMGNRSVPGADPASRAAGLARGGMRSDGPPGMDAPGFGAPGPGAGWGGPSDADGRDGTAPEGDVAGGKAAGAARSASPPSADSSPAVSPSTAAPSDRSGGAFGGPGKGPNAGPNAGPGNGVGGGFGRGGVHGGHPGGLGRGPGRGAGGGPGAGPGGGFGRGAGGGPGNSGRGG